MSKLMFNFSDPQEIRDPAIKDFSIHDPHLISGTCQLAYGNGLRVDVFGNTKESVIQFTKRLHVHAEGDTDVERLTSEVVVQRLNFEEDNEDEQKLLGETNMLVNIHFEHGSSDTELVTVGMDIDPPIIQGTHHVYTFSSKGLPGEVVGIKVAHGKVYGQLRRGAQHIVDHIDPLLSKDKDKEFTTDRRLGSIAKLKRFLDPTTMKAELAKLTKVTDVKTVNNASDVVMNITNDVGIHYALIIAGAESGLNKYRLFGRIERGDDE